MRRAGFPFWWYEVDDQADYRDESVWKQANPSDWITVEGLRREHERLPESVFRRLHLNQWTETDEAWIKTWEWDACRGRPQFDPSQPSYMAVDVGIRRDSAAITWGQWHGDTLHVGHRILIPADEPGMFGVADVRAEAARCASTHAQLREFDFDPW
jgi:phage terminase large subunit-like protein